jgi:hypothetical protein
MSKTCLIAAAGALAMSLTACSGEPTVEETGQGETTGQAPAAGASHPPAQAAAESEIPEVLRGRWGLVPADCTSTRGDAKGLLRVDADKLEFYESVAMLGPVRKVDADSISASFEFTGEGQSWVQEVALSTTDDGRTMVRQNTGSDAAPGPLTYTRCP